MSKTGIILAQLGGPRDQHEVDPFVRAIFADPDLVPLPGGPVVSKVFGWVVAKARGPFVRKNYRLIGGGSPILEITLAQGRSLESTLRERGHDAHVAVAMRYTRPDTHDAVRELVRSNVDRIVLLPLYPQYSTATTGSSENELRRVLKTRSVLVRSIVSVKNQIYGMLLGMGIEIRRSALQSKKGRRRVLNVLAEQDLTGAAVEPLMETIDQLHSQVKRLEKLI